MRMNRCKREVKMKRVNIITRLTVSIVLILAVSLVAEIVGIQLSRAVNLSAKVSLEAAPLKEKDIEQKRNLVRNYHNQGNSQATIKEAEEYLKLNPMDADIWVILAEHYLSTNKLTEAEEAVKEALELNSKHGGAFRISALIYRTKADQSPRFKRVHLSKAQSNIEKALDANPDDAWNFMEAAQVYLAQDKEDKALKMINKALELSPNEESFLKLRKVILSEAE